MGLLKVGEVETRGSSFETLSRDERVTPDVDITESPRLRYFSAASLPPLISRSRSSAMSAVALSPFLPQTSPPPSILALRFSLLPFFLF